MKFSDIANIRLNNQYLSHPKFNSPHDAVAYFGAVQSQDYAAAKWSLGLRLKKASDQIVAKAFNEGSILRTHVMRPTWHFVTPEDIVWMLELTSPRVKSLLAHYDRKLELDEKILSRCYKIITNSLVGRNYLTRAELAELLERNKIIARGQRLGHIVSHAELDALICSGPRRGKHSTYALISERTPTFKKVHREEALIKLATKYFTSHGPAQLKDFSWWSGLTMKDAKESIEMIKINLVQESIDGKLYWFSKDSKISSQKSNQAFLLSIYDEYVIAYKDRSALGGEQYVEKFLAMGNALTAVIVLDQKIIGTWRRVINKDLINIIIKPLIKLSHSQYHSISLAADRYGLFHNMKVVLS